MTKRPAIIYRLELLTEQQLAKFDPVFIREWKKKPDVGVLSAILLANCDDPLYSEGEQVGKLQEYFDGHDYTHLFPNEFTRTLNYQVLPQAVGVSGFFRADDLIELAQQSFVEYICPNDIYPIKS